MASVYFGTSVVTVPDASYQLSDILAAFQLSSGIIRRRGYDQQIVATMPFETLPSFEVSDEFEVVEAPLEGDNTTLSALLSSPSAMHDLLSSPEPMQELTCSGDAAAYVSTINAAIYSPMALSSASFSVYAPSVYNPRLTATTTLQERRLASATGYFAAVDPYKLGRSSGSMTKA